MKVQANIKESNHEAETNSFNVLMSDEHASLLSIALLLYHSQGFNSIGRENWKNVETVVDDYDDEDDIADNIGKIENLAASCASL